MCLALSSTELKITWIVGLESEAVKGDFPENGTSFKI